ncbi:MAG: hypothetical protein ACQEXJ_01125 [Myxococcota bacterium]
MRRLLPPLAGLLALLAVSPPAAAEKGELTWMTGVGQLTLVTEDLPDTVTRHATLVHGGARYAVTDFIQVGGLLRAGVGYGEGLDPEPVGQGLVEARYLIDALTWVPFLAAGFGGLYRGDGPDAYAGGEGPTWDVTAHGGIGVDWRPERRWSLGVVARYHVSLTELGEALGPFDVAVTFALYRD